MSKSTEKHQPRPAVPGSEIVLTLGDCAEFLREFCGIENSDLSLLGRPTKPNFFWPAPCPTALTYDRLAELIVEQKVPHSDRVPNYLKSQIDRKHDCRQAKQGSYLLWTPAGIESREVCSELRGKSYRDLWQMKGEVFTCREAVILWLFVYWKTEGQIMLDPKGWTRTCSRDV